MSRVLDRLARTESQPPWSFTSALLAVVAMFIALVIGTTVADVVLGDTPSTLLTGWSIGMILTTAYVLISRQRRSPEDAAALRINRMTARLSLIFLLCIGFAVSLDLISWIVTGDETLAGAELLRLRSQGATRAWIVAFLFMVVLQPIGEELVFRGMVFPALSATLRGWAGFLACAGLHAAFHMLAYPPGVDDQTVILWYGLTLPFLDALVYTGIRAYTGSTRASIYAHAAFGLFAVLKVYIFA